ncbi:MAG TPA: FG-GAP-like repeat-containing protein, partial [Thermoplasmata archaeon]|nr:FG-GAP-like repeat-containing protein [Thermoplasmata archaeon]
MVVGNFSGDKNDDVAIVCSQSEPSITKGIVEIKDGPLYFSMCNFHAGNGTNDVTLGRFNADSLDDIAVSNYYDSTVTVFNQPFSLGMSPSAILEIDGFPTALAAGSLNLDYDDTDDLAVCTEESSYVRFFFQSLYVLPLTENYNRSLPYSPSDLTVGDMNGDGSDDLLILSADSSIAMSMYQRASSPYWGYSPDARFPTGEFPRNSLIGHLDSDSSIDVAIASARADWNGSSIALYLAGPDNLSNSNMTVWTNANYEASTFASGDINGDGHEDLILLYPDINAFGYNLSYSGSSKAIGLATEPLKLVVADLNADGFCDVLTTEAGGDQFTVHLGDATGPSSGLFDTLTCVCSGNITDVAVGDLNNDGLPDVAVATDEGFIDVFINLGQEPMYGESYGIEVLPGGSLESIVIGDFDSDGMSDIAYPRPTRTISVILQREESPLSLPADLNLTASFVGEFAAAMCGDITGDGRDDIVGLRADDPRMYLFDQMSFGESTLPFDTLALPEMPSFLALLDATDDGSEDVLAIFDSADLVFLYRQEGGVLPKTPSMTFVTGASPVCAMVADGSQDHRGDLVVCDAASHSVSVWEQLNFAPVAHSGGPYASEQGDPLTFNGSATTGSSEIPFMEYKWDFGDGDYTNWVREPNPVHTYMEIDVFDVTMEVRDPLGLTDFALTEVTVVDSTPHVSFTLFPAVPHEGELITFNDTTTSYDDVILLNWTVDEVLVSSGMADSITDVFDDGPHSVTLEVTDNDGSVSDFTCEFQVLSMNPDAMLIAPSTADEGVSVSFEVVVDPWNDGPWDPIVSYAWNFSYEGGAFVADVVTTSNTTTMEFGADGDSEEYSVAVLVTDDDGDYTLCVVDITILDIGPDASLTLSDDVPGEGVPFTFIAVDSFDGVTEWSWTLTGPGGYSESFDLTADEMADVEFILPNGSYLMVLEVSEGDGDTDEFELDFDVAELPPSVTLTTLPASEDFVEFDEVGLTASIDSYDDIASFEWDFIAYGGEFVADESSVNATIYHIYNWAGNYTAKVRVTDSDGTSAVAFTTVEIVDRDLDGTFDDVKV